MGFTFEEKSLVVRYIQQFIKEMYNSDIHITGDYYKHFDMNYGMSHYIAKYLDYKYPILDKLTQGDYNNITNTSGTRELTSCISLKNYFLSDNKGKRLRFNSLYKFDSELLKYVHVNTGSPYNSKEYTMYDDIYNDYMKIANVVTESETTECKPLYTNRYIIENDLPLFVTGSEGHYNINENIIFSLQSWSVPKQICELDDFVMSYLLGQTITPESSREDIYYAQKLLYDESQIDSRHKGIWCLPGEEGTFWDMTYAIMNYQKQKVNRLSSTPLFVTGYFDIFTEAFLLKDLGEKKDGITGL